MTGTLDAARSAAPSRGAALVAAVILMLVLGGFMGVVCAVALNDRTVGAHDLDRVAVTCAAEGATNVAVRAIEDAGRTFAPITALRTGLAPVRGLLVPYTITPVGTPFVGMSASGLASLYDGYVVSAVARTQTAGATVTRTLVVASSSVFQFGVFYDDDLEIFPGADFTFKGRIHTNGRLAIGADGFHSLTLDTDYVRAAGTVQRAPFDGRASFTGPVNVLVKGTGTPGQGNGTYQPWSLGLADGGPGAAPAPAFAADAQAQFKGTIASASAGVTPLFVPSPESTAPGGFYDAKAIAGGLAIHDGVATLNGIGDPSLTAAGIVRSTTMNDAREGKVVRLTEIDLGKLAAAGKWPANGLIYASLSSAAPGQPDAVRLVNGAQLPSGLTVVTPDPLYVQGDFNTVAKQPAAAIADAVNLLSNSWNATADSRPIGANPPPASDTTYNFSFAAGNTPTVGTAYNGGLENFPRFHEDWGGITCTYNGSMAELWRSKIATQPWGKPKVYGAPKRVWSFDADLLNPQRLPPFTPRAYRVATNVYTEQ